MRERSQFVDVAPRIFWKCPFPGASLGILWKLSRNAGIGRTLALARGAGAGCAGPWAAEYGARRARGGKYRCSLSARTVWGASMQWTYAKGYRNRIKHRFYLKTPKTRIARLQCQTPDYWWARCGAAPSALAEPRGASVRARGASGLYPRSGRRLPGSVVVVNSTRSLKVHISVANACVFYTLLQGVQVKRLALPECMLVALLT